MDIKITNCRNIDSAEISVQNNKLNIKYAINGTGKSTIAKALELKSKNQPMDELIPFKYLGKKDINQPEITGLADATKVMTFDEAYLNQFTFQQEELISNSFNIFVKTVDYDRHMQEIENLLSNIKDVFKNNESLERAVNDLSTFIDSYGKAASGYSAAGALAKGIGNGNKVENIPADLVEYTEFIRSEKKVPWLGWQLKGHEYMDLSKKCPFCTSDAEGKKQTITKIKDHYDENAIKHLNTILDVIEKLNEYFNTETQIRLSSLSKKTDKLNQEEIEYLIQVKNQAIILRDKLSALKMISFFHLKDVDKVVELINDSKININYLQHFNSDFTSNIVLSVTEKLDLILNEAGKLQGEVNQQKITIENAINKNSSEINNFLSSAGYKYQVSIDFEKDKYRMKLRHFDYDKPIVRGNQYLSYGEKNALALVLFMYEAISSKADLIILDDPISSFDKNKKYAIIEMLFGVGRGFVNKTVILLTHDFEPIIDLMYTLHRQYNNKVVASFLELDQGIVREIEIKKDDIKTFTEICMSNINNSSIDIIKLIHLRRLYEISNNKSMPYELLSNLFHKRDIPTRTVDIDVIPLTQDEIDMATNEIQQKIHGFNYNQLLLVVKNDSAVRDLYLTSNSNFEKLELFRTITGEAIGDNVLKKYINETFHIENDYVMQLNPLNYQVIPHYVIDLCNSELGVEI